MKHNSKTLKFDLQGNEKWRISNKYSFDKLHESIEHEILCKNWRKDFKNLLPITKRPTFEYYCVELWLLKSYNYQRIWFKVFNFEFQPSPFFFYFSILTFPQSQNS